MDEHDEDIDVRGVYRVRIDATARVSTYYSIAADSAVTAQRAALQVASQGAIDEDDDTAWMVVDVDDAGMNATVLDPESGGEVVWEPSKDP